MYSMLIAKNQSTDKEDVFSQLAWDSMSISLIDPITDGLEAKRVIEKTPPDLLLVDMSLPQKSAIDLVQFIYDQNLPTLVILLTEPHQLQDAQHALGLGAYDVLTPPFIKEELLRIIENALEYLHQQSYRQQELAKVHPSVDNLNSQKIQTLATWLQSAHLNRKECLKQMNQLQMRLSANPVEVGLMRFVIETASFSPYPDADMGLIRYAAANILQETLADYYKGNIEVLTTDTDIIWIANSRKHLDNQFMIQLRLASHQVEKFLGLTSILISGPTVSHIEELPQSYDYVLNRMNRLHFKGVSGCHLAKVELMNAETTLGKKNNPDQIAINLKKTLHSLQNQSYALALQQFEEWIVGLKNNKFTDKHQIQQAATQLIEEMVALSPSQFPLQITWQKKIYTSPYPILQTESFDEIIAILSKFLRNWIAHHSPHPTLHPDVQKICAIIKERYFSTFTLANLTRQFTCAYSALDQKFKQEVGMSFENYLLDYRIEQSQLLLAQSKLSIDSIAREVGYKDTRTFNHLFKTWTGLTPTKYRNEPSA